MTENIKIATLDEKYVELIGNNISYTLLNNDIETHRAINVNKKAIKNLPDPVNNNEAAHTMAWLQDI